jgi:formate hydrogenlyase subunit 4
MNELIQTPAIALVQLAVFLLGAPLVSGMIKKTKARLQNRRGASVFQPYYDLIKLLQKEVIIPSTSSWVFRATPYIVFATSLAIVLLIPTIITWIPLHWAADIITVIYLFTVARFFLALAGLDSGSAFGGLGSSREMSIASIIEPAMMLAFFTTAVTAGSTDLSLIVNRLSTTPGSIVHPAHILAFVGLFIVTMAEAGRIPVDNPATHLELTMIHEAMILEYSGRHLAFIEWASQIKLMVFLSLLANMFIPFGMATSFTPVALVIGSSAYAVKIAILAVTMAIIETTNAKLRLFRVPELLMVAFVLSLLALILYFIIGS